MYNEYLKTIDELPATQSKLSAIKKEESRVKRIIESYITELSDGEFPSTHEEITHIHNNVEYEKELLKTIEEMKAKTATILSN